MNILERKKIKFWSPRITELWSHRITEFFVRYRRTYIFNNCIAIPICTQTFTALMT